MLNLPTVPCQKGETTVSHNTIEAVSESIMNIVDVVLSFFEAIQWNIAYIENTTAFSMEYRGKNGQWSCHLHVLEEAEQILYYSIFPIHVPEEKRTTVLEFLTYANYGLIYGNFEFNLDDGQIRYKTSVDVEGNGLSHNLLKPVVFINVTTMDRYFSGLMELIYKDISVEDALALVNR